MFAAALIAFREALEAVLMVGIIQAMLEKKGHHRLKRQVWIGAGLGLAVTLIAAVFVGIVISVLDGTNIYLFEGTAMFVAAVFLTGMAIWALKENFKEEELEIREKVQEELGKRHSFGLGGLAFVSVAREGIETVFLVGVISIGTGFLDVLSGVLIGIAAAGAIGIALLRHSLKLDLKKFFRVISVLLVLFAAGLVSHGIREYQGAGVLPTYIKADISWILPRGNLVGDTLSTIFGYTATPSLLVTASYVAYLAGMYAFYYYFLKRKQILLQQAQPAYVTAKKAL